MGERFGERVGIERHVADALMTFARPEDLTSGTNKPVFDIRERGDGRRSFVRDIRAVLPQDSDNILLRAITAYEQGDAATFASVAEDLAKVGVILELNRQTIGEVAIVTEIILKSRSGVLEELGIC